MRSSSKSYNQKILYGTSNETENESKVNDGVTITINLPNFHANIYMKSFH